MKSLIIFLSLSAPLATLAQNTFVDENGISNYEKLEVMEHLLLEQNGLETSVNPCKFFQTGDPGREQQTAAEWVRFVFHDFVTANVTAGTGGLDASLGFESDREENRGIAFVGDTLQIFNNFFSVFTPMSDIIGLGLADSLISCDLNPRLIKLRVGRKDATEAGPFGVPGPFTPVDEAFAAFNRAGFTNKEGIQAVACGHSLGAVNFNDHGDIVDESVVDPVNNKDGNDRFDSTFDVFDNTGVNEYLTNTGRRGGPLVVTKNVAARSDFRIFNSDGNATIRAMSSSQAFQNTCFTIFEKMLDTVPRDVKLSDVIVPRRWTVPESRLAINSTGGVSYVATIRTWHKTASPPSTANFRFLTAQGGNTGTKKTEVGVTFNKRGYGRVTDYQVNIPVDSPAINSIRVQDSYTGPVDQRLFINLEQTFASEPVPRQNGMKILVRAAFLTSLSTPTTNLTSTLWYGVRQEGTITPKLSKTTTQLTAFKTQGLYTIYQGIMELAPFSQAAGLHYLDVSLGTQIVSRKIHQFKIPVCGNEDITTC